MTSLAPGTETLASDDSTVADATVSLGGNRFKVNINIRQSGIYIAFVLVVVLFAILTHGLLLKPQNVSNLMVQNSYILILAIGMILVIISGHIDLSAGSVVAVTGAISAVLMVNHNIPWPIALAITLVCGALIGAWQGYWVAYFGIPAFIVTLAGMLIFRALTFIVLGETGIGPFPTPVRTLANGFLHDYLGKVNLGGLGSTDVFTLLVGCVAILGIFITQWRTRAARIGYKQAVDALPLFLLKLVAASAFVMAVLIQLARFKGMPWVLVLLAVLVVAYSVLTNKGVFGRHIYAIGGNLQAANLSGIQVKKVTFWIFVNMGVLAALAGVIFAGRLNQANATAGNNFELDAIAASFIGGAAVQGGVGKVIGAITGGLLIGVINNGMSLMGAPTERVMFVKGMVLLAAVAFDVWAKRRAAVAIK